MMKEFREFIARGNVMDLAVGVIIVMEALALWYDPICIFKHRFTFRGDGAAWLHRLYQTD